uniref:Uncharacterized protein n=1 Tax=Ciona intestinalis TaxID=7719 RepID=F6YFI1_CIOIN
MHTEANCKVRESAVCPDNNNQVWFLNYDSSPLWVNDAIDKGDWKIGKLHCPSCNGRLGSFNFIQQQKCTCQKFVVPPVWLQKSKVDIGFQPKIIATKRSELIPQLTMIDDTMPTESVTTEIEANLFELEASI